MIGYLFRRLLALLPTIVVPMLVLFILIRLVPGDPAAALLGDDATPQQIEALRERLGLADPIYVQFTRWLGEMVRFDFGQSLFLRQSVTSLVLSHAEVTMWLTVFSMAIALSVGPLAGILAASNHNRPLDRLFVGTSALGISVPLFWFALIIVQIFAVMLRWFPVAGYVPITKNPIAFIHYLTLPSLALGLLEAAHLFRYARTGMLDAARQPFVTTARSLGLPERTVQSRYVFRSALVPVATVAGLSIAGLLGGAVLTETIFNLPGVGSLLLTAVRRRDYPLIEGCVLFIAVVFVVINLVVDLIYVALDPRIRYRDS